MNLGTGSPTTHFRHSSNLDQLGLIIGSKDAHGHVAGMVPQTGIREKVVKQIFFPLFQKLTSML